MTTPVKPPEIVWGRWQSVAQLGSIPTVASLLAAEDREITYGNEIFSLLRPEGNFTMPNSGTVAMNYANGEAYMPVSGGYLPVALSNGKLTLDFNARQFDTSLQATATDLSASLQAQGKITSQGMLHSDAAKSNMTVAGTLSSGANEAGYLFNATLNGGQRLIGATRWVR